MYSSVMGAVRPRTIVHPTVIGPATGRHPLVRAWWSRSGMTLQTTRPTGVPPVIVGHRGACGYRPEHTVESYLLAARLGADSLEPDLVMTLDGQLVCRHESELSLTTDVAQRREFADRRRTRRCGRGEVSDWFVEDFTLAEIKTLWATERMGHLRASNTVYDGRLRVATFAELLQVRARASRELGREVGVSVELKHPSRYRELGMDMEAAVLAVLNAHRAGGAQIPIFVQSFELSSLIRLRAELGSDLPLILLIEEEPLPLQLASTTGPSSYDDLLSPTGLRRLSAWVDGVGPGKRRIFPGRLDGTLGMPTAFVRQAHAAGLRVHVWTFRAENAFLPEDLRRPGRDADHGDVVAEMRRFLRVGVDALICDQPDLAVLARGEVMARSTAAYGPR